MSELRGLTRDPVHVQLTCGLCGRLVRASVYPRRPMWVEVPPHDECPRHYQKVSEADITDRVTLAARLQEFVSSKTRR